MGQKGHHKQQKDQEARSAEAEPPLLPPFQAVVHLAMLLRNDNDSLETIAGLNEKAK
jgi:hypothetical protein